MLSEKIIAQKNGLGGLYCRVLGKGAPLLLLHGNGEDSTIFSPLAKALAPHFTLYMPDSPGHGQSPPPDSYTYNALAEGVLAFMEKKG